LLAFATGAYAKQRRKYTSELYAMHPAEVMTIITTYSEDQVLWMAAICHDLIEDQGWTFEMLEEIFGEKVANLVVELTDGPYEPGLNRAERKSIDCLRLALASPDAQTIKYADLISNTKSIVEHDPKFAKVYLKEKRALLEVMTKGDSRLREAAMNVLIEAEERLKQYDED
jgi:(p)ppGpp synthase/HD superfamily hydrolase